MVLRWSRDEDTWSRIQVVSADMIGELLVIIEIQIGMLKCGILHALRF